MTHIRTIEVNDLRKYPKPIFSIEELRTKILSSGDLHGNVMRLIYILRLFGVMALKNAKEYKKLWTIYNKKVTDLTESDLLLFETIINNATIQIPGLLIFIGDEFADRGSNDYFTALVFKKCHDSMVPYRIQLSNHGMYALVYIETGKTYKVSETKASLINLIALSKRMPEVEDKFNALIKNAYIDHLSLVGYTTSGFLTCYAHAPIDLLTIAQLANLFDPSLPVIRSQEDLLKTIDSINAIAVNLIRKGQFIKQYVLHEACPYISTCTAPECMREYSFRGGLSSPLYDLIWNRCEAVPRTHAVNSNPNIIITFAHGHNGPGWHPQSDVGSYRNLDSHVGMVGEFSGHLTIIESELSPLDLAHPYLASAAKEQSPPANLARHGLFAKAIKDKAVEDISAEQPTKSRKCAVSTLRPYTP